MTSQRQPEEYDEAYCKTWMFGRAWYIADGIVIVLGYAVGGLLPFGIQYLGYLPGLIGPARSVLTLFGIGMLGATVHCNYFFAHDANSAMYHRAQKPPSFVDPILYAVAIVGGGVTGLLFLVAIKAGMFLTVNGDAGRDIRPLSAILIAFCGGLSTYHVRDYLLGRFVENFNPEKDQEAPTPDKTAQTR